jgi:hypothetical protein
LTTLRHFLEANGFYRKPLKKLNTGHYKLDLKVNGQYGSFILDSGASSSCIGIHAREGFGLESHESDVTAAGAGATGMEASVSNETPLDIDGRVYRKVVFVLFDLSHVNQALDSVGEGAVDGILGADLLKRFRAVIDYGRNALYFK